MGIQLSDYIENFVGKEKLLLTSPFPTMFSKPVYCLRVKMSIYGVKS